MYMMVKDIIQIKLLMNLFKKIGNEISIKVKKDNINFNEYKLFVSK